MKSEMEQSGWVCTPRMKGFMSQVSRLRRARLPTGGSDLNPSHQFSGRVTLRSPGSGGFLGTSEQGGDGIRAAF